MFLTVLTRPAQDEQGHYNMQHFGHQCWISVANKLLGFFMCEVSKRPDTVSPYVPVEKNNLHL